MSIKNRLAALEVEHSPLIKDVRLASSRALALELSKTPIGELRTAVAAWPDADFAAAVESIREHVPSYALAT